MMASTCLEAAWQTPWVLVWSEQDYKHKCVSSCDVQRMTVSVWKDGFMTSFVGLCPCCRSVCYGQMRPYCCRRHVQGLCPAPKTLPVCAAVFLCIGVWCLCQSKTHLSQNAGSVSNALLNELQYGLIHLHYLDDLSSGKRLKKIDIHCV